MGRVRLKTFYLGDRLCPIGCYNRTKRILMLRYFWNKSDSSAPPSALYWLWFSRTLACRASQVFLASPSNMAVLGL